MTIDVRVALQVRTPLKWPQRCPRCGTANDLVHSDLRLVRNLRLRRKGESALHYFSQYPANESEPRHVSVPACRRHERSNRIGGSLLRKDILPSFGRWAAYACLALLGLFVLAIANPTTDTRTLLLAQSPGMWGIFVYGAACAGTLVWAHRVAWVRPVRLHPRLEIATLRFKDEDYAHEFEQMNPEATNPSMPGFAERLRTAAKSMLFFAVIALPLLFFFILLLPGR